MNNAKMWLVVSPNVGVPLFLGAVAVGSFAVHVAVLSNTTWVADYLSGKPLGAGAAMASIPAPANDVAKVAYIPEGAQEVVVVLSDGTTARAILQMPEQTAALK